MPNAAVLARRFEISGKTAQRNIDFMRDRMGAPLVYDPSQKGYHYSDDAFDLPRFPIDQQEILAVLIARNLLSGAAGGVISQALQQFEQKLFSEKIALGMDFSRIDDAFSSSWPGYSPASPQIFQNTAFAMLNNRVLEFDYASPGTGENRKRRAEPHHLQHYMASWVLTAWCSLRKSWRKFFLSRMDNLVVLEVAFDPRPKDEWKHHIEDAFGIFQGVETVWVVLRFTPFRARWIREQVWHLEQKLTLLADGSLELMFPVADFREVKMRVLQFGADLRVMEPEELKVEIEAEIMKMGKLYGG